MSDSLQGNAIVRQGERIATLALSVRAHVPYSPFHHALRLVYAEAVQSGAGKLDKDAWQDALGDLGSFIQVSLDHGDIDFSLRSVDTSLKKTLSLLSVLFSAPHFSDAEVGRVKRNLTNRLQLAKEDARAASYQMFAGAVFLKHDRRSSYPIVSLLKEIKKVTVHDLKSFHASLGSYPWIYTSGGSTESNEEIKKCVLAIRKKMEKDAVSALAYAGHVLRPLAETEILLQDIPNKQNIEFSIGAPLALTRTDAAYPAFVFGMSVLCLPGGFTGRLMSIVREKEGLTYGIYGRPEDVTSTEHGVWRITTFFSPKDAIKGLSSTLRELRAIHAQGITEDELRRFKEILNTRYALINDSLLKKVAESHALKKAGVSDDAYEAFKDRMRTMSIGEVNDALSLHLDPRALIISGAGPVSSIRKELEAFEG